MTTVYVVTIGKGNWSRVSAVFGSKASGAAHLAAIVREKGGDADDIQWTNKKGEPYGSYAGPDGLWAKAEMFAVTRTRKPRYYPR